MLTKLKNAYHELLFRIQVEWETDPQRFSIISVTVAGVLLIALVAALR